jgi:hypothetical protein
MSDRDTVRITANVTPRLSVELSKREAWRLYVLLADNAPFVRHALRVRHNNGIGTVSLSTPQERQDVLEALLHASTTAPLTSGLDALTSALKATKLRRGPINER